MLQLFKDWRFAVMWGLVGIIAPVVLLLLPEPLHVEFSWGFLSGWGVFTLIMWILARFRNRR